MRNSTKTGSSEQKYYIKYKWEMEESPTPLLEDSQINLPDSNGSGKWIIDISR
jgi:hypothetical protein